jgi:hypothetical protein
VTRRKFLGLTAVVICASVIPVAPRPTKRNPKRRAWRRRKRAEQENIDTLERTILNEMMRDARDLRRLKR